MDKLAEEQLKLDGEAASARDAIFTSGWQTLSQYFLPQDSDINVEKTEGVTGWTDRIFDTTALQAAQTMASGQRNWLTPSSEPWASYEPPEAMREDGDDAAIWLGRCSDIVMKELASSNFYAVANIGYLGVGVFGTDLIFCDEGRNSPLNFRHSKIGTYTIGEDDEGVVDTTGRTFKLTGRQAKQMFGEENLPQKMRDQMKGAKGAEKKFEFVHRVFPREDSERLEGRSDAANKPVASVYIAKEFRECVRVSGYDEMPYLCSRFAKWGTDSPWGYSPAYLALPDARQINYIVQYLDALAELHAYPRLLYPDNLEGDVDLRAGGVTTYDSTNPESRPTEWMTQGDYKLGYEQVQMKRDAINEAFFVPMFKMLGSDQLIDKKMTAYEISQRLAEKLEQFTPTFDRRVTEFLNPLLRRVFGLLYRQGKFGTPPPSMMVDVGKGVRALRMPEIVITSRISMALKALQNRGTEETFQFLVPLAESRPEVMDNFNLDATVRLYARNASMSPDLLAPEKSVQKLRAARAKMQQEQRMLAGAEQAAKAGKALGGAPEFMQQKVEQAMSGAEGSAA